MSERKATGDFIRLYSRSDDERFYQTYDLKTAIKDVSIALKKDHDENCDSDHEGDMNECPGTTHFWLEDFSISDNDGSAMHFDYNF